MKNILIPVLILLWILLGYKMCTDQQRCCGDDTKQISEVTSKAAPAAAPVETATCDEGVICFSKDSYNASYADNFSSFRDSLSKAVSQGQKLRIIGLYRSDESYNGSFANLGLHRADVIGKRFAPSLSSDQIELASQQVVGRELLDNQKIDFEIVAAAAEVDDKTVIYFPYNSTRKLSGAEIENYLRKVADRVKASGETVSLVGHTDSDGPTDSNQALGLRRATVIKDYLVGQGVSASQIRVASRGETSPVATNNTSEGKALNRRTELTIIK